MFQNNSKISKTSLFYFPINRPDICEQWVHNCANEALHSMEKSSLKWKVVCEKHFKQDCFTSLMNTKLTKGAVPTIVGVHDEGDVERCPSPIAGQG
jgi:hypothetical protein